LRSVYLDMYWPTDTLIVSNVALEAKRVSHPCCKVMASVLLRAIYVMRVMFSISKMLQLFFLAEKRFDVLVLTLTFIINLVENSEENRFV